MELSSSFDQHKPMIEFWRVQGIDCLKSNLKKIYFVYHHCYKYKHSCTTKSEVLFQLPNNDECYYNTFNVSQLSERDLFRLNNASSKEIRDYIYDRCKKLVITSTIANTFNSTKIIIPKFLYHHYCRH